MNFRDFCEKTSANIGLQFCPYTHDKNHSTTMRATKEYQNPQYYIEFSDLSIGHPHYLAEIFLTSKNLYIGTISLEIYDGKAEFEHYEIQVSPEGRYNKHNMPVNEYGEEIDGQLWQYYSGKSLKSACNSLLRGGALINPTRKPKKTW